MSRDITVKWYRANIQQSPDVIPMQLDTMNAMEASYYSGVAPFFRYNGYINTIQYDFQYKDLLTDTVNIDPITHQLTQYRIIADPEPFPDSHVELILDRMVGS